MPLSRRLLASLALLTAAMPPALADGPTDDEPDDGSFGLSRPIACKDIRGFEDYDVLPDASLTSEEKLLIYFRPRHFKTEKKGEKYEVHLTQEGRIRRRGQKAVLQSKPNLLDYRAKADFPTPRVYLRNMISLKGLKPGEYEFDVVLKDEVGQGATVTRSLPFTIVATPPPPPDEKPERDQPASRSSGIRREPGKRSSSTSEGGS